MRASPAVPAFAVPAFAVALVGFLGGVFPFVGLLGLPAIALALRDLRRGEGERRSPRRRLLVAAVALGCASTLGAAGWALVRLEPPRGVTPGSCPLVHAHDGAKYRLEASLVAGSLYPWAERRDLDRLTHMQPVLGEYRLRIQSALEETDHIDSLSILVIDHPADIEVLPTGKGELVAVEDALSPVRAVSGSGASVLEALAAEDGRMLPFEAEVTGEGEPRQSWILDFPRPRTDHALLVLRGRSSRFAEEAFARYLATMGQGMGPFMEWVTREDCPGSCRQEVMDEETERLGLPLVITVLTPGPGSAQVHRVAPVGPAVVRSFALSIELPPGGDPVSIRLEATPRFWEIDRVQLAPDPGGKLEPRILLPGEASLVTASGQEDVLERIIESDRRRVALRAPSYVDARFRAIPPSPGLTRSSFVALRGYYQVLVGGRRLIDLSAVLAHRWGRTSLPRFAASLSP